jgi:hypothetical protein
MLDSYLVIGLLSFACCWATLLVARTARAAQKNQAMRVVKIAVLAHLLPLILMAVLLVDWRPSVITPLMSTKDKIQLMDSTQNSPDLAHVELLLNNELISRLLRTLADLAEIELHSQIRLADDRLERAEFSLGLPVGYLNGTASGTGNVTEGTVSVELQRFTVGRVSLPGPLRRLAAWLTVRILRAGPVTGPALAAVENAEIQSGQARIIVSRQEDKEFELLAAFQSSDSQENIAAAVQLVRRWLAEDHLWTQGHNREDGLVLTTQRLFDWAQQAAPELSAIRQNQIALLAGGIALGHPRLVDISGYRLEPREVRTIERRRAAKVRAHGRQDLVQHFWVSAGLTQLASAKLSDLAGLSKEEMDAGPGGSGFSFVDLMADRAGVRFARRATESNEQALAMQYRLRLTWQVSDLIPNIDEIPEGINETELNEIYGGLGGPLFKRWSQEINRRLDQAPLLAPSPEGPV